MDYDALAVQYGAVKTAAKPPVDYDALAAQHGAVSVASEPSTLQRGVKAFADSARGMWEAPLALATSATGMAAGGAAQIGTALYDRVTGDNIPGRAKAVSEEVAQKLSYKPTSETAKNIVRVTGEAFSPIAHYLGKAEEIAREKELALTGATTGTDIVTGAAKLRPDIATKLALKGSGAALSAAADVTGIKGKAVEIAQKAQQHAADMQSKNSITDETNRVGVDAGFKFLPSKLGGSTTGAVVESFANTKKMAETASVNNLPLTNSRIKIDLGIPDEVPLSTVELRKVEADAYADGYEPLKSIGQIIPNKDYGTALRNITKASEDATKSFPTDKETAGTAKEIETIIKPFRVGRFDSAHAITKIQELRNAANDAYKSGKTDVARANSAVARLLEDQIEAHLEKSGDTEGLARYREARKIIAKSKVVEKSLVGSDVNAQVIKNEYKKRKTAFDGNLLLVAKLAEKHPETMKIPSAGSNTPFTPLEATTEALAGIMVGASHLGATTAASAYFPALLAIPAGRMAARYVLLSKRGQARMLPSYETPIADLIAGERKFVPKAEEVTTPPPHVGTVPTEAEHIADFNHYADKLSAMGITEPNTSRAKLAIQWLRDRDEKSATRPQADQIMSGEIHPAAASVVGKVAETPPVMIGGKAGVFAGTPENIVSRDVALEKYKAEQAAKLAERSAQVPSKGTMEVEGIQNVEGVGGASPMDKPLAKDETVAVGGQGRPVVVDTSTMTPEGAAMYEKARVENIAKAKAMADEQTAALEAEWKRTQKTQGDRNASAEKKGYDKAERSSNAKTNDDGTYKVDGYGFVMSDRGAPIWFADQKAAAKWWFKNKSDTQVFELHNYPGKEGFTIRQTKVNAAKKGSVDAGSEIVTAEAERARRKTERAK